jgi:hypothetical protein
LVICAVPSAERLMRLAGALLAAPVFLSRVAMLQLHWHSESATADKGSAFTLHFFKTDEK